MWYVYNDDFTGKTCAVALSPVISSEILDAMKKKEE